MPPYDVKREHKSLYAPRNTGWELLDVPPQQFLALDGEGNPNTSDAYALAVQALYTVAYTLKFASKKQLERDVVVAPLEGLWWADDLSSFAVGSKDSWRWTMLISQPEWIVGPMIEDAKQTVLARKKLATAATVRHLVLSEGRCAQALHVGSYDDEGPLLAELHGSYLAAHGLEPTGQHHEVYLSDPRRIEPTKLKTVLRQPVRAVG